MRGMLRARALHRYGLLTIAVAAVAGASAQQRAALPALANLTPSQACAGLQGLEIPVADIGLPTSGATIASAELVAGDARDNANGEFCKVEGATVA